MWSDKSSQHLVCWTRLFGVRQIVYGLGLIDFPHCTLASWLHYTDINRVSKDFKCVLWKRWSCKYDAYTISWKKQYYMIQNMVGASQQNAWTTEHFKIWKKQGKNMKKLHSAHLELSKKPRGSKLIWKFTVELLHPLQTRWLILLAK